MSFKIVIYFVKIGATAI